MITYQIKETIGLNFSPEFENPIAVVNSLSKMFESIVSFQTELIKRADPLIDIQFFLSDVRHGSILSDYIRSILIPEASDTTALPTVKGNLVEYSKLSQDEYMDSISENNGEIIKNDKVHEINNRIIKIAETTGVTESGNYRPPNKLTIASSLELLAESTSLLKIEDAFYFPNNTKTKEIRKVYTNIDYGELKNEMASRVKETDIHKTLTIKTADFLGKSKWKLKLENGKTIEVKILDNTWLEKFHAYSEMIGSGDFIEFDGSLKDIYDEYNNLIDSQYTILKVKGLHHADAKNELEF
ncbi:MAG: hypothetical protein Ta2B_13630 [Termitinemataceae bacterium]|nr:MAG: hypothetical protein Ta2B_13630 [Termitinemataceae bacterium]